jgi:alpha-tubulin suppressor-like RCC1 family protein
LLLCLFALPVLVTAGCGSSGSGAKPNRGEDSSATAQSDRAIAAGSRYTCALLGGGTVKCWGDNDAGQLGNGTGENSPIPVTVSSITNASAVSAASFHTCALLSGGKIECWGDNEDGQLGNGTTTGSSTPVQVSGITSASAVSASGYDTCALISGGTVECWGENDYGQLGDGVTSHGFKEPIEEVDYSPTPVMVKGITDATAVSVGGSVEGSHTCALLSGGTVVCWGWNGYGQLGNGTTKDSAIPVAVSGIANASAISAGMSHTCALLSGGTVECWGSNELGQLGNGKKKDSPIPVDAEGITDASAISAGMSHTCALLSGGTVNCWGSNDYGQLGNGTQEDSAIPVAVSGIANASAISAGSDHTCALLSGGTVKCWGENGEGQFGNGTEENSPIPVTGATAGPIRHAEGGTCALGKGGRDLGCLEFGGDCNIDVSGTLDSGWQFAEEGFIGGADANAQRITTGRWRIRSWPDRDLAGYATATDSNATRWKITDAKGQFVATARGVNGPGIAMVLLIWGPNCLGW